MSSKGRGSAGEQERQPWTRWFQRLGSGESGETQPRRDPLFLEDDAYLGTWPINHPERCQLLKLESIEAAPCVVLLGESGMGKTWVMDELREAAEQRGPGSVVSTALSLRESASDLQAELRDELTRGGPDPVIFLDGLEESSFGEKICAALAEAFKGQSPPRLRLAVRSAAWRASFRDELTRVWGDQVTIVELCPLTRDDVEASLTTVGDSASSLLHQLEEAGAAALLARPVTLLMIFGLLRDGQLPDPLTRRSLYERGMRLLVAERNDKRHGKPDLPIIDERVAAARRLAAVSVFCNQPRLLRGSVETGPSDALCVAELADNSAEPCNDIGRQTPPLTARHFDACLESGLFREHEGAVTWAHASFADFLAAEYVQLRKVPYAQLRSMLGLGGTAIPLHLEGALGWLAEGLPDSGALRADLLQTSPHILLQAMTVELSDEEKAQAVDFFLQEIAENARRSHPSRCCDVLNVCGTLSSQRSCGAGWRRKKISRSH
jgi:hypothetical protein